MKTGELPETWKLPTPSSARCLRGLRAACGARSGTERRSETMDAAETERRKRPHNVISVRPGNRLREERGNTHELPPADPEAEAGREEGGAAEAGSEGSREDHGSGQEALLTISTL